MDLDVGHLDCCAAKGLDPVKGIAGGTGMVERCKAAEPGLIPGDHVQIGAETARRDDHRLRVQRICAAIGVLHLHARHGPAQGKQAHDLVGSADLYVLVGTGGLEYLHQMRAYGRAALRPVRALYAAPAHQADVAEVGPSAREPADGPGRMLHEILHQLRDILILAAAHYVVIEQLLVVFYAKGFLYVRLGRVDTARGVVGIAAYDALFLQHDDTADAAFRSGHRCGQSGAAGAHHHNVATAILVYLIRIGSLSQSRLKGHVDGSDDAVGSERGTGNGIRLGVQGFCTADRSLYDGIDGFLGKGRLRLADDGDL